MLTRAFECLMRSTLVALSLLAPMARAQPPEALPTFSDTELQSFAPLLTHGSVGLVELERGTRLAAIVLAARVEAPADRVAEVVAHPEAYPSFMPAVSEVAITDRNGASVGFHWQWRTAVFALSGDAALTHLAASSAQSARGHRIVLTRVGGDLGVGREVWRILPRGPHACVVVLAARMDLRDANYLSRQLTSASRSINRSINLAMGFAVLLRVKAEAERRAGVTPNTLPQSQLHRPSIGALEPLLDRGDALFVESNGIELRQASVLSRLPFAEERVRALMLDPVSFCQALIAGSHAEVRQQSAEGTRFDWHVDIPILGSGGTMRLHEQDDRIIDLDALEGALHGGHWRFETRALAPSSTMVLGWASFDVADSNFILRAIIDADAAFRPGLSAAMEIMMSRALRIRLGWRPATSSATPR